MPDPNDSWSPNSYGWQSGNQGTFESFGLNPGILKPVPFDDGGASPAQTYPDASVSGDSFCGEYSELSLDDPHHVHVDRTSTERHFRK